MRIITVQINVLPFVILTSGHLSGTIRWVRRTAVSCCSCLLQRENICTFTILGQGEIMFVITVFRIKTVFKT